MSGMLIGLLGFGALMVLITLGVPIAFAMAVVGIVGTTAMVGFTQAMSQVALNSWEKSTDFVMYALPLFIFMGQLVFHLRIAEDLFEAVRRWLGRLPGGMAITAVIASAGFGAVTGVSAASVATMGAMVMPEMRRYKYDDELATGSLAAAGTLAIMIPPSVLMVVYGIWTETSIGALFIAGIIPGILLASAFSGVLLFRCWRNPKLGPLGPHFTWPERIQSLAKLGPILAIFLLVMGGIYLGIFTPTEAAGIGVTGVVVVGLLMGRLTWRAFMQAVIDSGVTTGMIFAVIIGGQLVARFFVLTDLTRSIVDLISVSGLNAYVVIFLFVLMYLVLGALLDVWGMLILTLPFTFPIVSDLGFDPVWFGIFVVLMTELALITPPVGINVYVMHGIAKDVPLGTIFRGVMPFVVVVLLFVALITAFPEIVLWLPRVAMR